MNVLLWCVLEKMKNLEKMVKTQVMESRNLVVRGVSDGTVGCSIITFHKASINESMLMLENKITPNIPHCPTRCFCKLWKVERKPLWMLRLSSFFLS